MPSHGLSSLPGSKNCWGTPRCPRSTRTRSNFFQADRYGLALSTTSDAARDAYVTPCPSCPSHCPTRLVGSDRSVQAHPHP